jgi:PP-loop superfamily ATP-utilizing enzyme
MADYNMLKSLLAEMGGAVIGYSGGVDSTLLAKAATDALGERAVSALVESCLVPQADIEDAVTRAEELGLNLVRIQVDVIIVKRQSSANSANWLGTAGWISFWMAPIQTMIPTIDPAPKRFTNSVCAVL